MREGLRAVGLMAGVTLPGPVPVQVLQGMPLYLSTCGATRPVKVAGGSAEAGAGVGEWN